MSFSNTLVKWVKGLAPAVGSRAERAPAIGRNVLRQRAVNVLQPLLKAHGFGRFEGNSARRRGAEWIDVVNLRFDRDRDTHGYALIVEAGRHFSFVDDALSFSAVASRDGQPWPTLVECHVRKRLFRRRRQPGNRNRNFWNIGPNGEWLDEALKDIAGLMDEEILPWLAWLDDLAQLFELAMANACDLEGKSRDAMLRGMVGVTHCFREVLAALIAFRLGRWEQCIALIEPILARGGILVDHGRPPLVLDVAPRARLHRLLADARAALAASSDNIGTSGR